MEKLSSTSKRQRSENWLPEDKRLLTELVRERVKDIENKNTDTNTNAKKVLAWADLCSSFNSLSSGSVRTAAQLKAQWGNIKIGKKKEKSTQRRQIFQTGGGPPPEINPENNEDIFSWLPNEFTIDSNEFDSDQINRIKAWGPEHSPKKIQVDLTTNNNEDNIQLVQEYKGNDHTPRKKKKLLQGNFQESARVQSGVEELIEEIEVIQDHHAPESNKDDHQGRGKNF